MPPPHDESPSLGEEKKQQQFLLLVEIRVTPIELRDEFVRRWSLLAAHCHTEPGTMEYSMWLSDKDEGRYLVLERYDCKDSYCNIHRVSEPFVAFKQWMLESKLSETVTGHSYGPVCVEPS